MRREVAFDAIMFRCLGAFIPTTTFIRDLRPFLQIRQFARLRSASCSIVARFKLHAEELTAARATPSRDLKLMRCGLFHFDH